MGQAKLPYTLVEDVSLEEYEKRADKFNIHGVWEWTENKVIIYELPSKPHETLIGEITNGINIQYDPVRGTDAHIGSMGAVRTRADNTGYVARFDMFVLGDETNVITELKYIQLAGLLRDINEKHLVQLN